MLTDPRIGWSFLRAADGILAWAHVEAKFLPFNGSRHFLRAGIDDRVTIP